MKLYNVTVVSHIRPRNSAVPFFLGGYWEIKGGGEPKTTKEMKPGISVLLS